VVGVREQDTAQRSEQRSNHEQDDEASLPGNPDDDPTSAKRAVCLREAHDWVVGSPEAPAQYNKAQLSDGANFTSVVARSVVDEIDCDPLRLNNTQSLNTRRTAKVRSA